MADYSDVIKHFKRMCWYYSRDKGQKSCPMCTSYPNCNIGQCRKIAFEKQAHFAATVMRWATEHPEPVYPTWGEWLEMQEVAGIDGCFETENGNLPIYRMTPKIWQPIPADMAQKLGVEPK